MTKKEQFRIAQTEENKRVLDAIERFNSMHFSALDYKWKRLRSCSAEVAQVGDYFVLRSYRTIIAIIDRTTDTCYDFLRYVYGYTSTSAQHISKFDHDYGADKWGCANRYTYKEV